MLQQKETADKEQKQQDTPLPMTLDPNDDDLSLDMTMETEVENEGEIDAIEKAIATTKIKPKTIRRNIERYLEERALKRRVRDVFDDELLLID